MLLAKFYRIDLGFSIRELAHLSDLTSSEISLIETGRLMPTDAQLAKLARALGVSTPTALVEEARLVDAQRTTREAEQVSA